MARTVPLAERIEVERLGAVNPAAAVRVVGRVDDGPAGLRRFERAVGPGDALGNARHDELRIGLVLPAAEAIVHQAGSGMRMRGGHEHPLRGDAGLLLGLKLNRVAQVARDHATVDDRNCQRHIAVGKHQAASVQRVVDRAAGLLKESAVANRRQRGRRNVDRVRHRPKLTGANVPSGGSKQHEERESRESRHHGRPGCLLPNAIH